MRTTLPLMLALLSGCAPGPEASDPPPVDAMPSTDSALLTGDATTDTGGASPLDGSTDGADPWPLCPAPSPRTIYACLGPASPVVVGAQDCLHDAGLACEQMVIAEVLEVGVGPAPAPCRPDPGQPVPEGSWLRVRAGDGREWTFGWQAADLPAAPVAIGEAVEVSWQMDYNYQQDLPNLGTELRVRRTDHELLLYLNSGRGQPRLEPSELSFSLHEEVCRGRQDAETCTRVDRSLRAATDEAELILAPGDAGSIGGLRVYLEWLTFMEDGGGCDVGPRRRLLVYRQ